VTRELTRLALAAGTFLATLVAEAALRASGLTGGWRGPVAHALDLAAIAATAWLVTRLLYVIGDAALARYRTDVRDNKQARTVHTQVRVIRRFTAVAIAVLAIGAMLTTFREVRLIGTSVLASAGVAAAIAAFAAQALLGNVFAGLQIAFGKSLRLDDVVVVEGEWGCVEEITLTYVVLHIWDDRRMILPTSYFTTHVFENWTRNEASLLGSVEFELDWSVPVDRMRDELRVIVTGTAMWDDRVSVLQVTDAVGGGVRLRALVSAADAPTLWDLRCLVRERLIGWLRDNHPEALPRVRAQVSAETGGWPAASGLRSEATREDAAPQVTRPRERSERQEPRAWPAASGLRSEATREGAAPQATRPRERQEPRGNGDARVFGGDAAGVRRARDFTGPEQPAE
jgi:hypothetical protein